MQMLIFSGDSLVYQLYSLWYIEAPFRAVRDLPQNLSSHIPDDGRPRRCADLIL